MAKPFTVTIHSNIEELQGLLAKAYTQLNAVKSTFDEINSFQIITTGDSLSSRVDSEELARQAGESLGAHSRLPI